MHFSLIAALLAGLPLYPAILPAGDAPVMRAENLGDTPLFTQPLLLAVANLDQRISATTETVDRARLTHQRALVLEQLTRTILSEGGNGFAATLPADELQRLRDTVSSARRSGDKTAEMTAILRLNNAILDQSFTDLLTTVARDWIRFAQAADFDRAFNRFAHRTAFNQVPFGRAVKRLEAAEATALSDAEQALIGAYRDYSQRAEVYDAVAQSLFGFVKSHALGNALTTKINIRATTIRNWDGKELLVPNKEFITGRLLNWSLSDQTTRLVLSIGIAYGSPVRQAMDLLEEAARENPNVLDEPSPTVIFETFGDNALGLLLRCFVDSIDLRVSTISALNEAINDKFNAAGISIAFPQRDLHLDTIKPLRVQLEHASPID